MVEQMARIHLWINFFLYFFAMCVVGLFTFSQRLKVFPFDGTQTNAPKTQSRQFNSFFFISLTLIVDAHQLLSILEQWIVVCDFSRAILHDCDFPFNSLDNVTTVIHRGLCDTWTLFIWINIGVFFITNWPSSRWNTYINISFRYIISFQFICNTSNKDRGCERANRTVKWTPFRSLFSANECAKLMRQREKLQFFPVIFRN